MEVSDRLKLIGQTLGAFLQIQNYLVNSIQQMSEHPEVFEKDDIDFHSQILERLNEIITGIYQNVNSLKGFKIDAINHEDSKKLIFPVNNPKTPEEQRKFERLMELKNMVENARKQSSK